MKPSIPLWRISVVTTADAEDAVSELLATITGFPAVAYFHLETRASHVNVFGEQGRFDPQAVRRQIAAGLHRIKNCGLDTGAPKLEIARVKRENWAESWKRHFKPIEIRLPARKGAPPPPSLLVNPSWCKRRPLKNQAVVTLNPGLSFGTGQHPTTSFCLRELLRSRVPGAPQSLLDIGTGSGILAIAAVKLGYSPVEAFDFDPEAVRVAGANARKNRVAHRLAPARGDLTQLPLRPRRQFDVVCANLISTLLIAQRRRIVNRLKPGGTLVLAGILAAEFAEVQRAFADLKLQLCSSQIKNEWCSGAFCFV